MAGGQHKLSRRAVLAGACSGVAALPRHSGLDPESMNKAATPDRIAVFMDSGFRRNDAAWRRALACYTRAALGLERVAHTEVTISTIGCLGGIMRRCRGCCGRGRRICARWRRNWS